MSQELDKVVAGNDTWGNEITERHGGLLLLVVANGENKMKIE